VPVEPLPTETDTLPPDPAEATPVEKDTLPELPLLETPVNTENEPDAPLVPALAVRIVTAPLAVDLDKPLAM